MAINASQTAITEESRLLLAAMLRDEMRQAVTAGIREAMTQEAAEEFATTFLAVVRKQAESKMGSVGVSLIGGLLKKTGLFLLLGGVVYAIGGWAALAAMFKVLAGKD